MTIGKRDLMKTAYGLVLDAKFLSEYADIFLKGNTRAIANAEEMRLDALSALDTIEKATSCLKYLFQATQQEILESKHD